ncbi:hypothetical protein KIH39_05970 [Telmatocola sphagniphila]|uniref:Uncharacterized protein n=1 Tax=Telmatocola sphagniphila TaxID=1123043 RepID=A0A8E6EW57_9BACT|nr:hypothetical protein [Telmatocola sphagniphila]QVL33457.1 hypothetical protein KIH39_05970 [Telmatocola sphagniphila]
MDKRSGIPSRHFAFGSLSIAVALPNNAKIMETRVMNPNLANSGTLGFMTMIGQMPSGSRICLVMDGKRVSNILSVD